MTNVRESNIGHANGEGERKHHLPKWLTPALMIQVAAIVITNGVIGVRMYDALLWKQSETAREVETLKAESRESRDDRGRIWDYVKAMQMAQIQKDAMARDELKTLIGELRSQVDRMKWGGR